MSVANALEVSSRQAQECLILAALRCEQPHRLAPVMALVEPEAFSDPALRALWEAIRWYWDRQRRVPTPEEMYRRCQYDPFVQEAGGWALVEQLLAYEIRWGSLEWAALEIVSAHRRSALRGRLLRAAMQLERAAFSQQVVQTLERLSVEMRQAANAIRILERNFASVTVWDRDGRPRSHGPETR